LARDPEASCRDILDELPTLAIGQSASEVEATSRNGLPWVVPRSVPPYAGRRDERRFCREMEAPRILNATMVAAT